MQFMNIQKIKHLWRLRAHVHVRGVRREARAFNYCSCSVTALIIFNVLHFVNIAWHDRAVVRCLRSLRVLFYGYRV